MPKKIRKTKTFYIDTNIAVDFAMNRDIDTVLVLERVKEKKWKCVSSTFLSMEMADYQQKYTFIAKEISKKRNPDDILRSCSNKNLNESDFHESEEWFAEFNKRFKNLTLYDFIKEPNDWALARDISFNSNLMSPDVIHLTSAILASINGYCDIFITKDSLLKREADKIIPKYKKIDRRIKLKVMDISEVKQEFFKN